MACLGCVLWVALGQDSHEATKQIISSLMSQEAVNHLTTFDTHDCQFWMLPATVFLLTFMLNSCNWQICISEIKEGAVLGLTGSTFLASVYLLTVLVQ